MWDSEHSHCESGEAAGGEHCKFKELQAAQLLMLLLLLLLLLLLVGVLLQLLLC